MNRFTALPLAAFISVTILFTSAAQVTASTNSAGKPPMVTKNPDGTFTVRKEPSKGHAKDAKVKEGLVIPAQVVVPIVSSPERKQ